MNAQEELNRQITNSLIDPTRFSKKDTKFVLDEEIKEITLRNFPNFLRTFIIIFKFCHYLLLVTSIVQLVNRRYKEYDDLTRIQQPDVTTEVRERFYQFTGIIYAKYNLEILNFIFYLLLVNNFHRLTMWGLSWKMALETFLSALISFKVYRYMVELSEGDKSKLPITTRHAYTELALLAVHILIVISFLGIYFGFRNNKKLKNIYRVHYLGKKIKRAAV